jgi:hypothetical protein
MLFNNALLRYIFKYWMQFCKNIIKIILAMKINCVDNNFCNNIFK